MEIQEKISERNDKCTAYAFFNENSPGYHVYISPLQEEPYYT